MEEIVYDGGGIQPDIKFEKPTRTKATEALLKSNAIFDFATQYYYSHSSIKESKDFIFSDDDYQLFIEFFKI